MNSDTLALMARCQRIGLRFTMKPPDGLHVNAPKGAITPDLVEELRQQKAAILAILASRRPAKKAPGSRRSDATRPDGQTDGRIRPTATTSLSTLTPLDVRVLVEIGVLPQPSVEELPAVWRQRWCVLVRRLAKLHWPLERIEHLALQTVLREMVSSGELTLDEENKK